MEIAFLIGRILFGGYFAMMGLNHFMKRGMMTGYASSKGVPMAGFAVFVTGLLLLFGGLGILFGVYVKWAVVLLVIFLLPTSFIMHAFWKDSNPESKMADMTHFMKNMALSGAALMILAIPMPWMYSLIL